ATNWSRSARRRADVGGKRPFCLDLRHLASEIYTQGNLLVESLAQRLSCGVAMNMLRPDETTSSVWELLSGSLPIPPRYEILGEVGRGGMGIVYRARHRDLDSQVAIKVTLPGMSLDRFRREAKLLARVRSPHVVAVHDFEVLPNGCPMLVMEWVEGSDLSKVLRQQDGPLPEAQALPWMEQVGQGMLAAAEEQIIHRDLKPSNILIDRHGRALVADFGLARGPRTVSDLSRSGDVLGTPSYMAPEQAEDPRSADTRADIYSFGATFYHALTG